MKNVPKNQRLVGVKWVFNKKKDGRFRPCIVAKGFVDMLGGEYSELFAPVVLDKTLNLVIILYLINSSGIWRIGNYGPVKVDYEALKAGISPLPFFSVW